MAASVSATRARLRALLDPAVAAAGCDLEAVELVPAGRRRVLRVVVDRDGGVTLDHAAVAAAAVSAALDTSDVMGELPYVLEVSSPGVDRPVRTPRQWRRVVGRLVRVTVADRGRLVGRVRAADEAGVTIDVAGEQETFEYAALGPGAVEVEFTPVGAASPGPGDGTT